MRLVERALFRIFYSRIRLGEGYFQSIHRSNSRCLAPA